jgi:hypothetical protein
VCGAALFTPNANSPPDQSSIKQGDIDDCWFVAAAAGAAQQQPQSLQNRLTANQDGSWTVDISGYDDVTFNPNDVGGNYSTANGDWLKALEMGYGVALWLKKDALRPYDYINDGALPSTGIRALTRNTTNTDTLKLHKLARHQGNLTTAFDNHKVVTVCTAWDQGGWGKILTKAGLESNHVYTVVQWDAPNDQVRLRNPHGKNPHYPDPKNNSDPTLGDDGYFWVELADLKKFFFGICYEQ